MPQFTNRKYHQDGSVTVETIPWTIENFSQHLAALRYEKEVSGITVTGVPISTERGEHRMVMSQLLLTAKGDSEFSIRLKTINGFVTLTASQIISACQAMLHYIASCFAVEDTAIQAVNAHSTDEQFELVLSTLEWPSRTY